MADVFAKVLEPATSFAFVTTDEVRTALGIPPGDTSITDETLQFMIDAASAEISTSCDRVFAKETVEEIWRCVGEPCDCADAASSRRIWLGHWPVKEADIESVEAGGVILDPSSWELEESSGKLAIRNSTSEPIVVTYTGGYVLPDEAPYDLKHVAVLLVRTARMQNMPAVTTGSGIRSVVHKESRVTYFSPKDLTVFPPALGTGGLTSAAGRGPVEALLMRYTRLWA